MTAPFFDPYTSRRYTEKTLAAAAEMIVWTSEMDGMRLSSSPSSAKIPRQPEADKIILERVFSSISSIENTV